MMYHSPNPILEHEDVRRSKLTAGHDLGAKYVGHAAIDAGVGIMAGDLRRAGIGEDIAPTLNHRLAAAKRRPAGMDASHHIARGPNIVHGVGVAVDEGEIESLVGK